MRSLLNRHRAVVLGATLLLANAQDVRADDETAQLVIVPGDCDQFWTARAPIGSSRAWDAMLSFAACIQDVTIERVDQPSQLEGLVQQLQWGLGPSLQFYVIAIKQGPDVVKLRAAYAVALGQVSLMTRARASLASPALRPRLEELLDPHARLAHLVFTAIARTAEEAPELVENAVIRYMVTSSRAFAAELRAGAATDWTIGEPFLQNR